MVAVTTRFHHVFAARGALLDPIPPPYPSPDAANTFGALKLSRLPRAPDQAYREKGSQALRVAGGSVGSGGGDHARVVRQVSYEIRSLS